MPTISELPSASEVSAVDEVLISQGGIARAASVGSLLASTQPAIIVGSSSILGRTSIGSGGPEQVGLGIGVSLSTGTLVADGRDHAVFPTTSSVYIDSHLVISNQGTPMLMQASLLRGLFSAGQNVTIAPDGVISTTTESNSAGNVVSGSSIGVLQVITSIAGQDLLPVSHAGLDYAIPYSSIIDGITINQAPMAGPAGDSDAIWVAQGSNVMASQTLGAIWAWIVNNMPRYQTSVFEVTTSINLDASIHNGRILVCSQPVTLTPVVGNTSSGFQCIILNVSSGNVILGPGFVSSTGILALIPWQSSTVFYATYSAGTIVYAAMSTAPSIVAAPGQPVALSSTGISESSITVSWQAPASGGATSLYIVQIRATGTTAWTKSFLVVGATSLEIAGLELGTSYDIVVEAQNESGSGLPSAILTVSTAGTVVSTAPA